MELGFETQKLRRICERLVAARKMLGEAGADSLHRRLADIEAADALTELPWLLITYGQDSDAVIELDEDWLLRVRAVGVAPGAVDWSRVDRIKIVDVERSCHER